MLTEAARDGDLLKKRNYRQAKRQKEEARKTRQMEKQQRRLERVVAGTAAVTDAPDERTVPSTPRED